MKILNKALDILALFLNNHDELALGDMARLTGLNKTTVSKIAKTLVKRNYLNQRQNRGKYSLGVIYMEFSGNIKSRIKLRDIAVPYLTELSRSTNETVLIAFGNGKEPLFTEIFHEYQPSDNVLRVVPHEGMSLSLHSTSAGKILLAEMSDKELQTYIDETALETFTSNTITDPERLKQELTSVKSRGFAYDYEEYSLGVRGIGAGIRNSDESIIGAISVVAPEVRMTHQKMDELATQVKKCAMNISREMGYIDKEY